MDKIREYLEQLVPITDEAWETLSKGYKKVACNRGDLILSEGDECDFVAFVEEGTFRFYHIKEGKEKVNDFWFSGEFISDYRSYLTQTPSYFFIEAMQEGIIWKMKRAYLDEVYEKCPNLNKLGRKITEQIFLMVAARLDEIHHNTPRERYLNMLDRNPNLLQEVPQYMLASYLGITAVSLSRIRSQK